MIEIEQLKFYERIMQMYNEGKLGYEIAMELEKNQNIESYDMAYSTLILWAKECKRQAINGNSNNGKHFLKTLNEEIASLKDKIDYENFKLGK